MPGIDPSTRILVVHDFKTMLRTLRRLLEKLGLGNVDEAGDGASALRKLRAGDFGLVIADVAMAPMSGLELLAEVRADRRLGDLPFLLVTTERMGAKVAAAQKAGVSAMIAKPFDARALEAKLASIPAIQETRRKASA